jgi:hypothetical protein
MRKNGVLSGFPANARKFGAQGAMPGTDAKAATRAAGRLAAALINAVCPMSLTAFPEGGTLRKLVTPWHDRTHAFSAPLRHSFFQCPNGSFFQL